MPSANGSGVLLGSREMRLRLDQRHSKLLQAMAKKYGLGPTDFAEMLLSEAVDRAAREGVMAHVLATIAVLWCSGKAA